MNRNIPRKVYAINEEVYCYYLLLLSEVFTGSKGDPFPQWLTDLYFHRSTALGHFF